LKLQKQRKWRYFSTGVGCLTDIPTIIESLIFFGKSGAYVSEVSQKSNESDFPKVFKLTAQ